MLGKLSRLAGVTLSEGEGGSQQPKLRARFWVKLTFSACARIAFVLASGIGIAKIERRRRGHNLAQNGA